MVFCRQCKDDVEPEVDEAGGFAACPLCGLILEDIAFASDVQFAKGADGEGELVGQFVSESGQVRGIGRMAGGRLWGARGDSHDMAVNKGRQEIQTMIDHFMIRPREDCLEAAHRLYRLALQQGFTKGRRVSQVAASCLYIICRQEDKPFMLIDYSDYLQVNVFSLGAVYIQLLRLLRLEDHPTFAKPADPSLFIHRFCSKLDLGREGDPGGGSEQERADLTNAVTNTALRLICAMKRDWMQTGRRPSGVCGAALFLACVIHGAPRSKRDIMRVVHVGWSTLDERVREFRATAVSALTAAEFEDAARAADDDEKRLLTQLRSDPEASDAQRDHACVHVEGGARHFAHGMCHDCFLAFMRVSGGIWASSADPPAFSRAEARREFEAALAAAREEAAAIEGSGGGDGERLALPAPAPAGLVLLEGAGAGDEARRAAIEAGDIAPGRKGEEEAGEEGSGAEEEEEEEEEAAAARRGRGRGRGRVRGRGRGRGRGRAEALEQEVEEEVGQLNTSLHDMREYYTSATAAATAQGPPVETAEGGDGGEPVFGARLLGYGRASMAISRAKSAQAKGPQPVGAPPPGPSGSQLPAPPTQDAAHPPRPLVEASQPAGAAGLAGGEGVGPESRALVVVPDAGARKRKRSRRRRARSSSGGEGSDGAEGEGAWRSGGSSGDEGGSSDEGSGSDPGFGGAAESLSELDEDIGQYLCNAEETKWRRVLWHHCHQDWLEEQREKQARRQAAPAAGAARRGAARAAAVPAAAREGSEEGEEEAEGAGAGVEAAAAAAAAAAAGTRFGWEPEAPEADEPTPAAAAAAAPAAAGLPSAAAEKPPRGKRGPKKPRPSQPLPEADSAAEAARAMLQSKKLSDKINYQTLESLFDGSAASAASAEALARHEEARAAAAAQGEQRLRAQRAAMEQRRGGVGAGGGADALLLLEPAGRPAGGAGAAAGGPPAGAAAGKRAPERLGSIKTGRGGGLGRRK